MGRVFNVRSGCMHTMHLLPGVAIQPNLDLKTRPKQLLGSLPLVIALPGSDERDVLKMFDQGYVQIFGAENFLAGIGELHRKFGPVCSINIGPGPRADCYKTFYRRYLRAR